jgi:hypothetical protein
LAAQVPAEQVRPAPHGVHAAPDMPQATAAWPAWHTPDWSQQPWHEAGRQPVGGGHAANTATRQKPSAAATAVFRR